MRGQNESARAVANAYMRHRLPQKKKLGRSDRHRDFTPLNAPDVEAHVWKRWGVRTQCYSLAVLRSLLNVEGFEIERIQRPSSKASSTPILFFNPH